MVNTLHVLNGDSTLVGYKQSGLQGDVLVWREVFSEGPLEQEVTAASFWHAREAWLSQAFGETAEGYQQKVLNELEKLNGGYDEINLWFEFDLHCQANLLGVLMLLKRQVDLSAPGIKLISPAEVEGVVNFRGMGELNGSQLETLYDARATLSEYDFTLAAEAWKAYVLQDAEALERWIASTQFWGNMPNLRPAMQAQVRRLSVNANGLNGVEQALLDIFETGKTSRMEIYSAFWDAEKIYGMGDTQLDIYLNNLHTKGLINDTK